MDTLAPPKEQLSKFDYEPPAYDQKHLRLTYRKKAQWEKMKTLEPEHRQAFQRLERHYYGAQGVDVRFEDDIHGDRTDVPDEFAQHRHAGLFENAKKAVGSPRVFEALMCQIHGTLTPQDIGHRWAAKKSPTGAKSWGEGLIMAGLDTLVMHWGLITKPPD